MVKPSGPFETNAYIVSCPNTKKAVIIDPGIDSADALIDHLSNHGLTPTSILLTHSHWDHIGNVAVLKKHYRIPVCIHPLDAKNLQDPGSDGLPLWITIEGVEPDCLLHDGQHIACGTKKFQAIHTPGHTPGGLCFHEEEEGVLFSGDTLFRQSIGNLSFPTAQPDLMWQSLERLAALPPHTTVYPGHGPQTTIGQEPWLREAKQIFGY